jgi:hypothetical protein
MCTCRRYYPVKQAEVPAEPAPPAPEPSVPDWLDGKVDDPLKQLQKDCEGRYPYFPRPVKPQS